MHWSRQSRTEEARKVLIGLAGRKLPHGVRGNLYRLSKGSDTTPETDKSRTDWHSTCVE